MMAALREWLTSIVMVTLLVSLAQTLVPEGTLRKVSSFVGGLLLLAALVQPLLGAESERLFPDLSDYGAQIEDRRRVLESAGQEQLAEEVARLTADRIEAQAVERGLQITAKVETVSEPDGVPLPSMAVLKGEYSKDLAEWIAAELGIPETSQTWRK